MKKFLLALSFAFLAVLGTDAQYVQLGNNTIASTNYGPIYRPSATTTLNYSNHVYLYDAAELKDIPKGARIYRIDWNANPGTGGLAGNNRFQIWMENSKQSTITVSGNSFASETAGMPLAYNSNAYTLTPGGGWISHALDDALVYDGDNIKMAVAFERRGTATGSILWRYQQETGKAAGTISSINPSGFNFSTFYSNRRPDIRIYYAIPFPNDVGLAALEQPKSFCGGAAPVVVRLTNFGNNIIDSVLVNWSVDGQIQTPKAWRIPLDTIGGFGQNSTPLFIGTYNFIPGRKYDIRAWTSMPNGVLDTLNNNDTVSASIQSSLKGTYVIGPSVGADYNSIQDAIADLNRVGLCGDVNFQIDSGTYAGNFVLANVIGSNLYKTTFQSASGNRDDVVLTNGVNGTIFNVTAPNVIFANLTFRKSNTSLSGREYMVEFASGALNGVSVACLFDNQSPRTNFNNRTIGINGATNVSVILNTIQGGNYGVDINGSSTDRGLFAKVIQNKISDCERYGVYAAYQSYLTVNGNSVSDMNSTFGACIYANFCDNVTIAENKLTGRLSRYGLYLNELSGSSAEPNMIVNNSIGGSFTTTSGNAIYAIGREDSLANPRNERDYLVFLHNSINVEVMPNASSFNNGAIVISDFTFRGIRGFDSVIMYNNSVVAYSSGTYPNYFPLYFNNTRIIPFLKSDHNNFWAEDDKHVITVGGGINYTNLTAWRSASGQDLKSVSGNPSYASATLLAPSGPLLDEKGKVTFVTNDIVGNNRDPLKPDIGAYEFKLSPTDLGILEVVRPANGGCDFTAADSVEVVILNYGTDPVANYGVNFQIGTLPVVSEQISDTIHRGDTVRHTFSTTANFFFGGTYDFRAFTTVTGDGNNFNDTLSLEVVNPSINIFPYKEDFEKGINGFPSVFPNGWESQSASANMRWDIGIGRTPSGGTGPNFDHTLQTNQGKLAFFESSFSGVDASLVSPCIKIPGNANLGLSFWYHKYGSSMGDLFIEVLDADSVTWQQVDVIRGQTHFSGNDPWLERQVSLAKYSGKTIQVRFRATRGNGGAGDCSIDDVQFSSLPAYDVGVVEIVSPISGCGKGAAEDVIVDVVNFGSQEATNFIMAYKINGGPPTIEFYNMDTIQPGDTARYTFNKKADLSQINSYSFDAATVWGTDGNGSNDSLTNFNVDHVKIVNTFPHSEDFENVLSHGWSEGGSNSTWGLGTPGGVIINTAGSGNLCWTTNLIGQYSPSELSYVQSPCFDLSSLKAVRIRVEVNYALQLDDGCALQYSLDSGQTWVTAGVMNDPDGVNWYNSSRMNDAQVRAFFDNQFDWWSNPNSPGWQTAELEVPALAGQSSVLFRFAFGSNSFTQSDGFAFDLFRVDEPIQPVIDSFTKATDTCSAMARQIDARVFGTFAPIRTVNLHYDITGSGSYTVAPMAFNTGTMLYGATIPAGPGKIPVNYFITAVDTANNGDTTDVCTFTDDYITIDAGRDTTILGGAAVTLQATGGGGQGTGGTVLVTESATDPTDFFEIMNVGSQPINVTGWKVALSNSYTDINLVNAIVKTLNGTMNPGASMVWDDNSGSGTSYWGNNIFWTSNSPGWVIILDASNNVMDFAPFNWGANDIANFGATIGGATITLSSSDWMGAGPTSNSTSQTLSRIGNADNNDANDWAMASPSRGIVNPGLMLPFAGGGSYSWSDGSTVISTSDTAGVSPTSTTTYYVTYDDGKCQGTDSVTVTVSGVLRPDVAITVMVNPVDGTTYPSNNSQPVQVWVKNVGNANVSSPIPIAYSVNGNLETSENVPISSPLIPGDSVLYTFSKLWVPMSIGANNVCAYTILPNDGDVSNDTLCASTLYTSLKDLEKGVFVEKVYPVPADEHLIFELNPEMRDAVLVITSSLGQIVSTISLEANTNGNMFKLNTAEFAQGVYQFEVRNELEIQTGSFIIAR